MGWWGLAGLVVLMLAVMAPLAFADEAKTTATRQDSNATASAGKTDLPLMPKDPNSFKGRVEMKVESGLIEFGPILLFGLLMASGVGLAMGEDVFIIPAGFLMQRGVMSFWWTVAAAYFGVVLADTIWVLIVRRFSHRILRFKFFRRLFHPRRILEIKYKFDRYGAWVVVASRFIPFSRTPVFTAAGLSGMNIWKFLFAEALSALPVVAMQLGFGWLLAMGFTMSSKQKHIQEAIIATLIVLVVAGLFYYWRRRKRSSIRPPRAPVAWLHEAIRRRAPGNTPVKA